MTDWTRTNIEELQDKRKMCVTRQNKKNVEKKNIVKHLCEASLARWISETFHYYRDMLWLLMLLLYVKLLL